MTRGTFAQRVAEYVIRRACRHLPGDTRDERYREWTAELPAILQDPGIRFAPLRSAHALRYAAGTARVSRRLSRAAGSRRGHARRAPLTPGVLPTGPDALILRAFVGVGIYLCLLVVTVVLLRLFHSHNPWPLIAGLLAAASFVAFCLITLVRADEVRFLPKWGWAIVCLIEIPLGGLIYLSIGRVRRPRRAPPESLEPEEPR